MKRLIEVTRDPDRLHSMYLRYSKAEVARQESLDGETRFVNVDWDDSNKIVGIELVAPDDESVDLVAQFAHAHKLSLVGVFIPEIAQA